MERFEIKRNYQNDEYYVNIRIGNQTLYMAFQMVDWSYDTIYFNVVLGVYNKRKHKDYNEDHILMTGQNPLATVLLARSAFKALEREVLEQYNDRYKIVIYCSWVNNVRRDVYYRVLSKMGYSYGKLWNQKVIMKSWEKSDYESMVG